MSSYSGAADYGTSIYGSAGNQHAVPGGGNLIQMKHGGGINTPEPGVIKGGRRGGTGLGEMLVPAGLVLANNYTYNRYRGKKSRSGKASRRRGRGFSSFSRYFGGEGEDVMPKIGGNAPMPPQQMGGSTFVDLAVPAGLVYANDRYYNRKRRGFTNRKRRGSRRTRGRRRR